MSVYVTVSLPQAVVVWIEALSSKYDKSKSAVARDVIVAGYNTVHPKRDAQPESGIFDLAKAAQRTRRRARKREPRRRTR